ncbi:MAG: VIT and VWA domain-containing protein [Pseudomonadota bacterium]
MKPTFFCSFFLKVLIFISFLPASHAAGLLTPKNSGLPDLELQEHHVETLIENGFAITTVTQTFNNPHAQDLEAIYSFPVPEQAAVGELTVWINGNPVTGEVVEKKRAKQIYNEQKAQGRHVGITEQNGYKTFQTSVSPIKAQQNTKVRLRYFQPAFVDHNVGRYVYPLEDGGVDEAANAFWSTNDKVKKAFSFTLKLRSAYPIDAIRLPKHAQAKISQVSSNEWQVSLTNSQIQPALDAVTQELEALHREANHQESLEEHPAHTTAYASTQLNQDIVVYWKHPADLPGSVDLVTYKPDANKTGTFMMTFTPGDDLKPITTGIDWVFVLDQSGSMHGKYHTLLDGVSQALGKLRAQDRFRILLFDNKTTDLSNGYQSVSPESVNQMISQLKQTQPRNGTNLYQALHQALKGLDQDRPSGVILVTDGVANVGETKQKKFIELLDTIDVRLFTFVMGNSANKPLLKAMTKHSGGFSMNVSNSDDIVGRVLQASSKITHHAIHNLQLSMAGVDTFDLTPERIGSLYRGEQLVVFGHYRDGGTTQLRLTGTINHQEKVYSTEINMPNTSHLNPEIERLWAFATIMDLREKMVDFPSEDHQKAITDIALQYGIVTPYTSMLVVEEAVKSQYQIGNKNKQRLQKEKKAREQRQAQPVAPTRADESQPMFTGSRPSSGGSFNLGVLFLIGFLLSKRIVKRYS